MYEVSKEKTGLKRKNGAVVCEEHVVEAVRQGFTIYGHPEPHSPLEKCPGGECFLCTL